MSQLLWSPNFRHKGFFVRQPSVRHFLTSCWIPTTMLQYKMMLVAVPGTREKVFLSYDKNRCVYVTLVTD